MVSVLEEEANEGHEGWTWQNWEEEIFVNSLPSSVGLLPSKRCPSEFDPLIFAELFENSINVDMVLIVPLKIL